MFKAHSIDSAPAGSAAILEGVNQQMGFVPNLFAYLAESPTATSAYAKLNELLGQSSLSGQEVQIALLTTSVENQCRFCVAAHSAGSTKAGVDPDNIAAIRGGRAPQDDRQAALVGFVREIVRQRGWVAETDVQAFLDAGFDKAAVFDVITAVSLKTLSNYSNHLTQPELNPELADFAWEPAA